MLAAVESAARLTRRTASGESGTIRLSFTAASAYRTLPRIVAHIRAKLPAIDLVLEEMVSDEQIQALEENRIDVGVLRPSQRFRMPARRLRPPPSHTNSCCSPFRAAIPWRAGMSRPSAISMGRLW